MILFSHLGLVSYLDCSNTSPASSGVLEHTIVGLNTAREKKETGSNQSNIFSNKLSVLLALTEESVLFETERLGNSFRDFIRVYFIIHFYWAIYIHRTGTCLSVPKSIIEQS